MTRTLHDLVGMDGRRPSPFCWRTKLALAHKGLEFEARPVALTGIPELCGGGHKTVPILEDGERVIGDSWAIADYLDATYPDRPPLFSCAAERGMCRFTEAWLFASVVPQLFSMIVCDIHDHALPQDRPQFRATREKRLGCTLEAAAAGREDRVEALRAGLSPIRLMLSLQKQPFVAGDQPGYADYMVAGILLWAASVTTLPLLTREDPVLGWFERIRDLYDGLGRTSPTYALAV